MYGNIEFYSFSRSQWSTKNGDIAYGLPKQHKNGDLTSVASGMFVLSALRKCIDFNVWEY